MRTTPPRHGRRHPQTRAAGTSGERVADECIEVHAMRQLVLEPARYQHLPDVGTRPNAHARSWRSAQTGLRLEAEDETLLTGIEAEA